MSRDHRSESRSSDCSTLSAVTNRRHALRFEKKRTTLVLRFNQELGRSVGSTWV